jgi:hypothetical protein
VIINCTVFIVFGGITKCISVNFANAVVFMGVGYVIKLNKLKHKYKASFIICVEEGAKK